MGWALLTECLHELFDGDLSLTQNTRKRPGFDLAMHWNDAAFGLAFHDDVTSALTDFLKPEPLEGPLNLCAGDVRQLRHALARAP